MQVLQRQDDGESFQPFRRRPTSHVSADKDLLVARIGKDILVMDMCGCSATATDSLADVPAFVTWVFLDSPLLAFRSSTCSPQASYSSGMPDMVSYDEAPMPCLHLPSQSAFSTASANLQTATKIFPFWL
jgi:hypothetical protein